MDNAGIGTGESKIRVVHVITSLGSGGAERMLVNVVRSSPDFEHSIIVLSPQSFYLPAVSKHVSKVIFLKKRNPVSLLVACRREVRLLKPDLVQSWMFHADLLSTLATFFRYRNRHFWGLQAGELPKSDFGLSIRVVRRTLAALSWFSGRRVVACSTEAALEAVRIGYRERSVTVVPNAVDTDEFANVSIGLAEHPLTFVCPARWHPMKGHRVLLEAWSMAQVSAGRLLLVGSGCSSSNNELRQMIDELGIADSVETLGERTDMAELFCACDYVVLSSISGEGLPLALCEAMACGLPPVVTDVGGMQEVVGDTGLVVRPGQPSPLAEALAIMISLPPSERIAMSERARKRIVDNFSISAAAQRYQHLWREAASGTKGPST